MTKRTNNDIVRFEKDEIDFYEIYLEFLLEVLILSSTVNLQKKSWMFLKIFMKELNKLNTRS